jgi:hypothetical protein
LGTWETSKEHDDNMLGTHQEQGRKTKNNYTHFALKGKKRANHEHMLSLPIGCMKFLFPK